MAKTYVPQLGRMAMRLNSYLIKHNAALQKHITDPTTKAALTSCTTCLQTLALLLTREQP